MEDELYFTNDELDVFAEHLQTLTSKDVVSLRKSAQAKLIELNPDIMQGIKDSKMILHNHAHKNHMTSLIFPCSYNKGKVNWIGIRYGKAERDIKELNRTVDSMSGFKNGTSSKYANKDEKDIKMQFQKHACLQVNIGYTGLEVGIFHAVPWGAIDRMYLHDILDKNDEEKINKIKDEIRKIQFYGYKWHVYDTTNQDEKYQTEIFDFDLSSPDDFIKWYSEKDKDGCFSSMLMHFPRYDKRINKDNIVNTCLDVMKQLYPLYKAISWDISYKGNISL